MRRQTPRNPRFCCQSWPGMPKVRSIGASAGVRMSGMSEIKAGRGLAGAGEDKAGGDEAGPGPGWAVCFGRSAARGCPEWAAAMARSAAQGRPGMGGGYGPACCAGLPWDERRLWSGLLHGGRSWISGSYGPVCCAGLPWGERRSTARPAAQGRCGLCALARTKAWIKAWTKTQRDAKSAPLQRGASFIQIRLLSRVWPGLPLR